MEKKKKVKKFINNRVKIIIAFILGALISGGTVYATYLYEADDVSYSNTTSGMASTNVQDALDELYDLHYKFLSVGSTSIIYVSTTGKALVTKGGICVIRNKQVHCISNNNWSVEKDHVQQVYSDGTCTVTSTDVSCTAGNEEFDIYDSGDMSWHYRDNYSYWCNNVLNGDSFSCN